MAYGHYWLQENGFDVFYYQIQIGLIINSVLMKNPQQSFSFNAVSSPYKKIYEGNGSVDLHYQICSTFLKNTGENLNRSQLRIMAESNKLLDALQQSKTLFNQNETMEDSSNNSERSKARFLSRHLMSLNSDNIEGRLLARKSPKGHSKYIDIAFSQEMKDIEENCSPKTIKSMKGFMEEYKKLKNSLGQFDISEKKQRRRIQKLEKEHEKFLVLKKVQQENQNKVKILEAKVKDLEGKIVNNSQNCNETQKMPSNAPLLLDPKIISQLTRFLNEKEKIVDEKMKRVEVIQENIVEMVRKNIAEAGCQKCCTFMKKIKEYILKLRKSLQEEGEDLQNLYNRYKAVFCSTNS